MTNPVVSVQGLGKRFRIGAQQSSYKTLRETLTHAVRDRAARAGRWLSGKRGQRDAATELWALRDVSFDVRQGEVLGIIGRNGSGKSTLLKVLSRITEPTEGSAEIRGRVGALLEVGTGFHPELTGRENIYLNGAILGMKRAEIARKFDEIVAFSEIERFLDTAVKHYSSGMFVRLAFAVAAHMDPEILLVDEVLAVGDAAFQKKCLGKMGAVANEGRTIFFVSHAMPAVASLCTRAILLKEGCIAFAGDTAEAIARYGGYRPNQEISIATCAQRGGDGGIRFTNAYFENRDGARASRFRPDEPMVVRLDAAADDAWQHARNLSVGMGIDSMEGERVATLVSSWQDREVNSNGAVLRLRFVLPAVPLVAGRYFLSLSVSHSVHTLDYVERCASFEVEQSDASHARGRNKTHGYLSLPYTFEVLDVHAA